jgi:hypothetical protein
MSAGGSSSHHAKCKDKGPFRHFFSSIFDGSSRIQREEGRSSEAARKLGKLSKDHVLII